MVQEADMRHVSYEKGGALRILARTKCKQARIMEESCQERGESCQKRGSLCATPPPLDQCNYSHQHDSVGADEHGAAH